MSAFEGRSVLVTGGGTGIGKGCALHGTENWPELVTLTGKEKGPHLCGPFLVELPGNRTRSFSPSTSENWPASGGNDLLRPGGTRSRDESFTNQFIGEPT